MQRFFTTIMTTTMLVHAAFGCCLHHAHSFEVMGEVMGTEACDEGVVSATCCGRHDIPDDILDWEVARQGVRSAHDQHAESTGTNRSLQSDHGVPEHSHQGRCPCEGDKCNFARTESQSGDGALDSGDFLNLLDIAAISNQKIVDAPFLAISNTPRVVSSTLRRHLMLAVLLI